MSRKLPIAALIFVLLGAGYLHAQTPTPRRVDLAVTYLGLYSLKVNSTQRFWSQGGAVELGTNVCHGFGIAANVTGTHASSIGNSGVPLSLVTATFGPRYRWHADRRLSLYGEGLIGEANGFYSLFPEPGAAISSSNSLAAQAGGGIDYKVSDRFAVRVLDAAWLRTQLPNSTNNVQNSLQLGAGLVVRFGH